MLTLEGWAISNMENHIAKQRHSEAWNVNNFKLFCYITCILPIFSSLSLSFALRSPISFRTTHLTSLYLLCSVVHMFSGFVPWITWIIIYIKYTKIECLFYAYIWWSTHNKHTHIHHPHHGYGLHVAFYVFVASKNTIYHAGS